MNSLRWVFRGKSTGHRISKQFPKQFPKHRHFKTPSPKNLYRLLRPESILERQLGFSLKSESNVKLHQIGSDSKLQDF
jgi:hypothetical protein